MFSLAVTANQCGEPQKVMNAVIMTPYVKEYPSDSEVTYQCRDKYTAVGEEKIQCKNGEWKKPTIECRRMYPKTLRRFHF